MISSGFKFLFVVIFLSIYFCNASSNVPKNEETCKCGFVHDPSQSISIKKIIIKTSNEHLSGTDDTVKITMYTRRPGEGFEKCSTNGLDNPGVDDLDQGKIDVFDSAKTLGGCMEKSFGHDSGWITILLESDGDDSWLMAYTMIVFTDGSNWQCVNSDQIWLGEGQNYHSFNCELLFRPPGGFNLSPELVTG